MLAASAARAGARDNRTGLPGALDDEFLELVCSDEELLRAEFDAIIAREWESSPSRPGPPDAASPPGRGDRRRRDWWSGRCAPSGPDHPVTSGWRRQRSPPRTVGPTRSERTATNDEGRWCSTPTHHRTKTREEALARAALLPSRPTHVLRDARALTAYQLATRARLLTTTPKPHLLRHDHRPH